MKKLIKSEETGLYTNSPGSGGSENKSNETTYEWRPGKTLQMVKFGHFLLNKVLNTTCFPELICFPFIYLNQK